MQPSGRLYASISLFSASSPSFGTRLQCPPTTRLIRPLCASRLRPRSLPSPGAAANISVRSAGWRSFRKRRSSARINSSGVPMPTKPDTHIVSPSRTMAIASSAETILFLSVIGSRPLGQPVRDPGPEQGLRFAADEHADMAAGQRQFACSPGCRPSRRAPARSQAG